MIGRLTLFVFPVGPPDDKHILHISLSWGPLAMACIFIFLDSGAPSGRCKSRKKTTIASQTARCSTYLNKKKSKHIKKRADQKRRKSFFFFSTLFIITTDNPLLHPTHPLIHSDLFAFSYCGRSSHAEFGLRKTKTKMRQLRLFPIAVLHRGFLSSLAPTLVPLVNFLYVIILVLLLPPSKRHHHHDQPLAFNCLLAALSPLVISLSLSPFFLSLFVLLSRLLFLLLPSHLFLLLKS